MSDPINDGGPAFPVPEMHFGNDTKQSCANQGMTLRDWFAGQALVGLLGQETPELEGNNMEPAYRGSFLSKGGDDSFELAHDAYCFADAMIEARRGGNP